MNSVSCVQGGSQRLDARLTVDLIREIGSFLSDEEQFQLAQVSEVTAAAALFTRQFFHRQMVSLDLQITQMLNRRTIEELRDLPSDADVQRCFVDLVTSPISGHARYWVPVMNRLMTHFFDGESAMNDLQKHAQIARLLEASEQPISFNQGYRFFQYLTRKILEQNYPWWSYRILEKYMAQPKLHLASESALKEYLVLRVSRYFSVRQEQATLSYLENSFIRYQEVDIDPRFWFGLDTRNESLWVSQDAQNGGNAVVPAPFDPFDEEVEVVGEMPDLLIEVFCARIEAIKAFSRLSLPFVVTIDGRTEATIPRHFIFPLVQRLVAINGEIFIHSNRLTEDEERVLNFPSLRGRMAFVKQRYPNAISRSG